MSYNKTYAVCYGPWYGLDILKTLVTCQGSIDINFQKELLTAQ